LSAISKTREIEEILSQGVFMWKTKGYAIAHRICLTLSTILQRDIRG